MKIHHITLVALLGILFSMQCSAQFEDTLDIVPIFECLDDNRDGTLTMYFGYENKNPFVVYIPIGPNNLLLPEGRFPPQIQTFMPGRVTKMFQVRADISWSVNWRIVSPNGNTLDSTADSLSLRCPIDPETLPRNDIVPIFECLDDNRDGTYSAYFGYTNNNDFPVYIPIGDNNLFTPEGRFPPHIETFMPGRVTKMFHVRADNAWTLNWKIVAPSGGLNQISVTSASQRCNSAGDIIPILECITHNNDGTFSAFFGYLNQNSNAMFIEAGIDNKLTPEGIFPPHPETFLPGRQTLLFHLRADESWTVGWHVRSPNGNFHEVFATTASPECVEA